MTKSRDGQIDLVNAELNKITLTAGFCFVFVENFLKLIIYFPTKLILLPLLHLTVLCPIAHSLGSFALKEGIFKKKKKRKEYF